LKIAKLNKLVKWFCRQVSYNELASAYVILQEVLNGTKHFQLKPEKPFPHYRQFRVDIPPLTTPPAKKITSQAEWTILKQDYKKRTGKVLRPIRRRGKNVPHPDCICEHCGAPSRYLSINDGKKGNQVRCKICEKLSPSHRVRRNSKHELYCPHCGYALGLWKQRKTDTVFKCPNAACPHFISNKAKLTKEEKAARKQNKYDPNFKLHYQYRKYHFSTSDILPARPTLNGKVNLARIKKDYHTLSLVLSLSVNFGMSSRMVRHALKGFWGIDISHQTVINYTNAAAALISPWLDKQLPVPENIAAADETYIIVEDQQHYTWFVIDCKTRAICGYNISNSRDTASALGTLYNTYGTPKERAVPFKMVVDGLPSYDNATMAYNEDLERPAIDRKTVIGLENLNAESKEFRPFKQMIERLNRTYKFHTRPRAGFKSFAGAVNLTTLFVAYYNFLRPHSSLEKSHPPVELDCLKGVENFPKQWEILLRQALG
jgi:putative transposase